MRLLPWALFALFVAMWLALLAVLLFRSSNSDEAFALAVLGYPLVGAVVASRQPRNAVGWLLLLVGIFLMIGGLVDANLSSSSPVAIELSAWLSDWTWYIWLTSACVFLPLVFPSGRLVSRGWRAVLWFGGFATAASVVGAAFGAGRLDAEGPRPVENPVGVGALAWLRDVGEVALGAAFVLAAASLVVRFRRSRGVERQQLKWFVLVGLTAVGGLSVAMIQVLFGTNDPSAPGGPLEVIGAIGWFIGLMTIVLGLPVATGLAILRHRLYDIDVVINRTLVYGALTASLVASYLALVLLMQLALKPLTEQSDVAIAVSTLAVAALFRPLRARIQALVDRRFYRRKYDAARTLEQFGGRLRDQVDLDALDVELRQVIRTTLDPAHVSLWVRSP